MNEELSKLIGEAKTIAEDARETFGHLSEEQLNWKPNADEWSVAQCFDHLIVINSGYFPLIEKIARGEHKPSLKERLPLLPRIFGPLVINAVKPQAKRKLKATSKFQPSSSAIGGDIIAKFVEHQQAVVEHIKMTAHLDLKKIVITSPVASFVTYTLSDAYKVVVEHEKRHFAQAKRVMETEGFPKEELMSSAAS
jgi:hypothetical protein